MIIKAPSFFTSRCPEILALQNDLQADFVCSQLSPFLAQTNYSNPPRNGRLCLGVVGLNYLYPRDPHSIMFFNPNKYVYESPKCSFQGCLFR